MSFLIQPIQVLASSGNGIDADPPAELSDYATLLNDRGSKETVVTGNTLIDVIALHSQFLLKLRGSNGLEGLVVTNPYSPGHIIDPTNPRKWYETGGKVGLIYSVAGKGFLGVRTV